MLYVAKVEWQRYQEKHVFVWSLFIELEDRRNIWSWRWRKASPAKKYKFHLEAYDRGLRRDEKRVFMRVIH